MVEEHLGPLCQGISSLIEVVSLVQASRPLNQIVIVFIFFFDPVSPLLVLLCSEVSIVKLLFPAFDIRRSAQKNLVVRKRYVG